PYSETVLLFGVLHPARPDGRCSFARPGARAAEWAALASLLEALPPGLPLLHFGEALPRWYEEQAWAREADVGLAGRFVDLAARLRGAALYPGPVFSLAELVRHGLGGDPLRGGHAGAAAMWAAAGEAERLVAKARADLEDLAALKQRILDDET